MWYLVTSSVATCYYHSYHMLTVELFLPTPQHCDALSEFHPAYTDNMTATKQWLLVDNWKWRRKLSKQTRETEPSRQHSATRCGHSARPRQWQQARRADPASSTSVGPTSNTQHKQQTSTPCHNFTTGLKFKFLDNKIVCQSCLILAENHKTLISWQKSCISQCSSAVTFFRCDRRLEHKN